MKDRSETPMESRLQVPQTTVDNYVQAHRREPDLIKIDVEGAEAEVLEGCLQTLAALRPFVLFECWTVTDRDRLAKLFARQKYSICALPVLADRPPAKLSSAEFFSAPATNFGAVPDEVLAAWPPR